MKKATFKEITLMNAVLCLCVVMIHLTSTPLAELTYGSLWHIIIFIANKALCFSVPAFIFLSGFKLYNKYSDTEIDVKRFFIGRFKKIIIPYLVSVLVYFIYFFFVKKWVTPKELPEYIFLGTLAAHFYYVVIATQAYLLFPLIKPVFKKFALPTTAIALICTVCCLEFLNFTYTDRFIGTYIFYFVLGMVFARYNPGEKLGKNLVAYGFVITAIIHLKLSYTAMSGEWFYRRANIVNLVYVTLAIFAIYGVCTLLCEKSKRLYSCAKALSGVSYDVYLYHILAIFLLQYELFPRLNLSVGGEFAVSFAAVYLLIFIYAFWKKKI